ncbi:MAG: hypothetical protein Q9192_004470 [Flavoplaca navasiana]
MSSHPSKPSSSPSPSPLALHTHAFISAFIAGSPPSETLTKYFTPTASIHEHGPDWARKRLPFLAKTFRGRSPPPPSTTCPEDKSLADEAGNGDTMDDYYDLLGQTLRFQPTRSTLPGFEKFNVDGEKGVVSVVLEGGFESLRTGRGWWERFVYVVGFEGVGGDGEGGGNGKGKGERKIQRLDLWADPLSAWVAVGGEEREEEGGRGKGVERGGSEVEI